MTVCDPIELFDADSLQDPYPLYNQLRAAGPVGQIGDSEFYAVSSWDGVVEAMNIRGEEYGEERLLQVLAAGAATTPDELLRRIMGDLDTFVGATPQHDDITCLLLKVS